MNLIHTYSKTHVVAFNVSLQSVYGRSYVYVCRQYTLLTIYSRHIIYKRIFTSPHTWSEQHFKYVWAATRSASSDISYDCIQTEFLRCCSPLSLVSLFRFLSIRMSFHVLATAQQDLNKRCVWLLQTDGHFDYFLFIFEWINTKPFSIQILRKNSSIRLYLLAIETCKFLFYLLIWNNS